MQMSINYNITAKDKSALKDTIYNTVYNLGKPAVVQAN